MNLFCRAMQPLLHHHGSTSSQNDLDFVRVESQTDEWAGPSFTKADRDQVDRRRWPTRSGPVDMCAGATGPINCVGIDPAASPMRSRVWSVPVAGRARCQQAGRSTGGGSIIERLVAAASSSRSDNCVRLQRRLTHLCAAPNMHLRSAGAAMRARCRAAV